MIQGSFIVLEGIDGAGTTTQAHRLGEWFRARGLPVLVTREPTSGPIGSVIRQVLSHRIVVPSGHGGRALDWRAMALLFAADRLDHLDAEVVPNLLDGVTVVCDRYDLSSLVYQSATAEDTTAVAWLRELNRFARRPDLTIVLDVPVHVAQMRIRERGGVNELYEDDALQRRLAELYASAEALVPGDRVVHVNGAQPADDVAADVVNHVRQLRSEV